MSTYLPPLPPVVTWATGGAADPVAVVYDADGNVYDRCYTWEAGQSYALHEGRRVEAVADDRGMTVEDAQRLYDAELAAHVDCWGVPLYLQGGDCDCDDCDAA